MPKFAAMDWNKYFEYDAASGSLIWKPREAAHGEYPGSTARWNGHYAGRVAGHAQGDGAGNSIYVRVNNTMYRAHRVVWEMHRGSIPDGMVIDHINGDYLDNRLSNLRLATKSQNGMNRGVTRVSSTRLKGVSVCPDRPGLFVAQITTNGQIKWIGRFKSKGLAAVAYAKASLMHHGKFSPFYRSQLINA